MAATDLIATQICIQTYSPVFLWGPPGVGKTAVMESIAGGLQERLWTVILSIREPSDQGGLPVILEQGVKMHPPLWAAQLCEVGKGIVFFDEFNAAPPTTQSSALRVVHGGWAGDQKLPETTSFVACGNPPNTSTGVYDLTSAIANRWVHLTWPLDPAAWSEGMVAGWPAVPIVRLPEKWRAAIPAKRGLLAAFMRRKPQLLFDMPDSAAEQGGAWSSPRSWDRYALLQAAATTVGHDEKSEVGRLLCRGCVGEASQVEFTSWVVNLDLRDPEEYIQDPTGIPLPDRQDQIMATLDSVAAAALDQNHKKAVRTKRYYAAWKVLGRILKSKGDIAIPAARTLAIHMPPEVDRNLPPEVEDILPMLEAAGIDFSQEQ